VASRIFSLADTFDVFLFFWAHNAALLLSFTVSWRFYESSFMRALWKPVHVCMGLCSLICKWFTPALWRCCVSK